MERFLTKQNNFDQSEPSIRDEWVISSLYRFVRLGDVVGYQDDVAPFRNLPKIDTDFNSDSIETHLVESPNRFLDPEIQVLSVLLNGNFRRGNMALIDLHRDTFLKKIKKRTIRAQPIEIVLPTLPFKDQNPLTTRHSLDFVDLGEYLFLSQMRDISESVRQVYPPGLRLTILSDGPIYSHIFANGQEDKAKKYMENCQTVAGELGIKEVEILDMAGVVNSDARFAQVNGDMRDSLERLWTQNEAVNRLMRSLIWGMLVNIPGMGFSYMDFKNFLKIPLEELPFEVRQKTREAAFEYASFSLTINFLDSIARQFPDALRATVHAKDAPQIPLHLVNRHSTVFPYNGVPLVSERKLQQTGSLKRSARIVRFCDVLSLEDVQEVYVPNKDEPFYYMIK